MARGQAKRPETPDEKYQRLMESGEVIQMFHHRLGVRYITNTEFGIRKARNCGFVDVEYVEETIKKPVARAAQPKPVDPPKPSGGKSKGGE
jgi:hypothetical protein